MLILLPIFYGALGFGMDALSAWIYNIAAKNLEGDPGRNAKFKHRAN